jgi:hypothetical protein
MGHHERRRLQGLSFGRSGSCSSANLTPLQISSVRPSFAALNTLKGRNACTACSHPLCAPFTPSIARQTQLCIAGNKPPRHRRQRFQPRTGGCKAPRCAVIRYCFILQFLIPTFPSELPCNSTLPSRLFVEVVDKLTRNQRCGVNCLSTLPSPPSSSLEPTPMSFGTSIGSMRSTVPRHRRDHSTNT